MIIRMMVSVVLILIVLLYAVAHNAVAVMTPPKKVVKQDPNTIHLYQTGAMNATKRQVHCLTQNIFFEAGIEDRLGKYAVGQVTLNRLKLGHWGDTVCKVVFSEDQFSWTRSKKLKHAKVQGENWEESYQVAVAMINGIRVRNLETALFYHADYVNPFWKLSESRIAKIGRHIFYERAEGSWLAVE